MYSPTSSVNVTPSSSPVFGPVDSSPPSSPGLAPYTLDSPPRPSAPFLHPFAASTKAIKLPSYEKKAASPPCTPPGTFTLRSIGLCRDAVGSRSLQEDAYMTDLSASPPSHRTSKFIDHDERVWDEALRKPFDTGIGQIDLSNQRLKYIPPSIGDLAGFFNTPESSEPSLFAARVFARINTEPTRVRSFERAQSIKDSGKERHVLKLYLMGNAIASLPPELFTVKNLTVLSLRGNNLTYIPPEICHLTHLHELNISNNHLTFLPWQMRDMTIEKLLVNPNPFLPEPHKDKDGAHTLRARRSITRLGSLRKDALAVKPVLSPLVRTLPRVPPLTELCLRLLLAPASASGQTVLVEYYGLPLADQWTIPPSVRRTLAEAVPGSLRPRKRFSADTRAPEEGTGTGTCPNPAHRGRVFARHGSERFAWVRRVAGVDVGGAVPLRWRGCLGTCLDFLVEEEAEEGKGMGVWGGGVPVLGPRLPRAESEGESESESDVDVDAVQAIDLGQVRLDMDDFDE